MKKLLGKLGNLSLTARLSLFVTVLLLFALGITVNSALTRQEKISNAFAQKTSSQAAIGAANYLLANQNKDGAIPDAYDSSFYNSDNNMNYAGVALYYAWKKTKNVAYIDALGKMLDFMAQRQESDGSWHYAYQYNETTSSYYPAVWDYYKNEGISGIKTVDAVQSFFAYDLWLYSLSNRNRSKVITLIPVAEKGIKRLIADNYDGSKFFYSSWQFKTAANSWQRYEAKYSTGQIDVYLGLRALARLMNNQSYSSYANSIKSNFDAYYWDSAKLRYVTLLNNDNSKDSSEYLFIQGYAPAVFGNTLPHSQNAYNYLKSLQQMDGSISSTVSPDGETLISAMTVLAANKLGQRGVGGLLSYITKMQVSSSTNSNGGIKFNKVLPYLYINIAGFSVPALFSDTLIVP